MAWTLSTIRPNNVVFDSVMVPNVALQRTKVFNPIDINQHKTNQRESSGLVCNPTPCLCFIHSFIHSFFCEPLVVCHVCNTPWNHRRSSNVLCWSQCPPLCVGTFPSWSSWRQTRRMAITRKDTNMATVVCQHRCVVGRLVSNDCLLSDCVPCCSSFTTILLDLFFCDDSVLFSH